jgi:hypothetical protein
VPFCEENQNKSFCLLLRNQLIIVKKIHRLAEFIPWNRFLGSINVKKIRALKWPSDFSKGIDSVELMPRVLKSLKIPALNIYTLFKGTASLKHKKGR